MKRGVDQQHDGDGDENDGGGQEIHAFAAVAGDLGEEMEQCVTHENLQVIQLFFSSEVGVSNASARTCGRVREYDSAWFYPAGESHEVRDYGVGDGYFCPKADNDCEGGGQLRDDGE